MRSVFLLSSIIIIAIGCAPTDLCTSRNLRSIRTALELVKNAPNDEYFEAPCTGCSKAKFVGMSLEQVKSCLGISEQASKKKNGYSLVFSLYKLPEPKDGKFTLGGGPELVLRFGHDKICTSAEWWHSQ